MPNSRLSIAMLLPCWSNRWFTGRQVDNAQKLISVSLLTASLGVYGQQSVPESLADEQRAGDREIETIYVTGTRTDLENLLSPGVVSVAFPDEVKGEHKSLPDILDQIAGVYVRRVSGTGQYTTTSIRGSAPSQVNIYIDGVPYNTSSEVAVDLSTLPIANVERVEVYRGSTPARFSGAPLGGAINIVTRAPEQLSATVSAGARALDGQQTSASLVAPLFGGHLMVSADTESSAGDFQYQLVSHKWADSVTWGDGSGLCCLKYVGRDKLQPAPRSELPLERSRRSNRFERDNALLKWHDKHFTAKASVTRMDRYLPANILQFRWYSEVDLIDDRRRQQQEDLNIALGWQDSVGELDLSANLNYSEQDKRFDDLDVSAGTTGIGTRWSTYSTERHGAAVNAGYTPGERWGTGHHLEFHAEYMEESMRNDANDLSDTSLWIRYYERTRIAVQLQDSITVSALEGLQIAPVLRMEKVAGPPLSTRTNLFGTPSGDYGWKQTWGINLKQDLGNWQLFTNYGTYNRYPNFYEIYGDGIFVFPNWDSTYSVVPLLRETGDNLDIGFSWNGRFGKSTKGGVRTTYFERETENAITLYATPIGAKYINSGTTFTRGLELEGSLVFGEYADLQFAVTAQEGRYVEGTYYIFGGHSAAQRVEGELKTLQAPDLVASTRLNLYFKAFTVFGEVRHTGRKYIYQTSDAWAYEEPLTTLGLGGHYSFGNGLKFSVGVDDLFDNGPDQEIGYTQGTPRGAFYSWWDCADGDTACRDDPANRIQEEAGPIRRNVGYPGQGRTLYATVAYRF